MLWIGSVDDVIAKLATWKLNALEVKELVQIAVKPQNLKQVRERRQKRENG